MNSTANWPCAALPLADLAERTTLKVGGAAQWLLEPRDPEELAAAYRAARERGLPVRVLGGGANLLIEDGVLPGVVIATDRLNFVFRPGRDQDPQSEWSARVAGEEAAARGAEVHDPDDRRLVGWCGVSMPGLVRRATELGWSGLEGLAGVPGHLGGGVAMNAGGRWGDLWDVVESVCVVDEDGNLADLARADCNPTYRDGGLGGRIVVGAVLRLAPGDRHAVREAVKEYLDQKRRTQPVTEASAGCIFKNPDPEQSDGRSAGQLVEACGAKGFARGAARVSELHGNFIVNRGGATAADVFTLVEDVRDHVAQKSGVRLRTEVRVWRHESPA